MSRASTEPSSRPASQARPSANPHLHAGRLAQPEVLACECDDVGVDLDDVLAPRLRAVGRRQGACQGAAGAADMHDPPRAQRLDEVAHAAQVVELQMARVREIDVGRVHVALAQQPARRPVGVALDEQVARLGEDLGAGAAAGHLRNATSR
jgi:hypothetical protein